MLIVLLEYHLAVHAMCMCNWGQVYVFVLKLTCKANSTQKSQFL